MSILLAAVALAFGQLAPVEAEVPRTIELGEARVRGWAVHAWTRVDRSGELPTIGEVLCEAERHGVNLTTSSTGGLMIRITDPEEFDPRGIRTILVDGEAWEYRWLPFDPASTRFVDVDYPPMPPPPEPCGGRRGHDIILYGCPTGVVAGAAQIRRSAGEPWLQVDTLANELVRANRLRLGYVATESPPSARLRWADVPIAGVREALRWCQSAMGAEAARRFHRN